MPACLREPLLPPAPHGGCEQHLLLCSWGAAPPAWPPPGAGEGCSPSPVSRPERKNSAAPEISAPTTLPARRCPGGEAVPVPPPLPPRPPAAAGQRGPSPWREPRLPSGREAKPAGCSAPSPRRDPAEAPSPSLPRGRSGGPAVTCPSRRCPRPASPRAGGASCGRPGPAPSPLCAAPAADSTYYVRPGAPLAPAPCLRTEPPPPGAERRRAQLATPPPPKGAPQLRGAQGRPGRHGKGTAVPSLGVGAGASDRAPHRTSPF